jgi:tRNA threonylcarbamoyladenosine biosynthesis protein TsaE
MQQTFGDVGLNDLPEVAKAIIQLSQTHKLVAFYGQMGAGKTTLIKQICAQLGVTQEVSSPTFALVNEYETSTQQIVYHFDFYRIKNLEEVYDIGYEDYFYSNNLCLMEWPENIAPLLENEEVLKVHIKPTDVNSREVLLEY